ncbi:hypothetical protein Dimus_026481, partial [Dionaea muscipula]
ACAVRGWVRGAYAGPPGVGRDSSYSTHMFRRRFRMRWSLFFRIQADIEAAEPFFTQRPDATGD